MIDGFRFAAVSAGIKKKKGALDLGLIVADEPVSATALFTKNLVRAHPVTISEQRLLAHGRAQAWLVNAGNANACNGKAGHEAAISTCRATAEHLRIEAEMVLPSSTGVIGQVLPAQKIEVALPELVPKLSPEGVDDFANAILTTDRWAKKSTTSIRGANGKTASVLAIGKGAGMFHPDLARAGSLPQPSGAGLEQSNLGAADLIGSTGDVRHATMLVYIVTDAAADSERLTRALERAADVTFNSASVDGDTSTNDSVYLMASGKSGVSPSEEELAEALIQVCRPLVRSMVRDGEGAEHVVEIVVKGLETKERARTVARTIATSPLVKTALTGKDANWGRLLMAAGRSGVPFDPREASVSIGGVYICRGGTPTSAEADVEASQKMQAPEYTIEVELGSGPGQFSYITSDLGHAYIDVNAGYRT